MAELHRIVYVCEFCFTVSEKPGSHHDRPMVECDAGCPGDDCTQPIVNEHGLLLTHAPKWWIYRHRRHELSA